MDVKLHNTRRLASYQRYRPWLLGPVPAPMAKRASFYRYQLLMQSPQRGDLQTLLDKLIPELAKLKIAAKVRWSLDVDPIDLQ
jgi:primosomal protein N' (replication factor Y)